MKRWHLSAVLIVLSFLCAVRAGWTAVDYFFEGDTRSCVLAIVVAILNLLGGYLLILVEVNRVDPALGKKP
jgi:hypothetical protein